VRKIGFSHSPDFYPVLPQGTYKTSPPPYANRKRLMLWTKPGLSTEEYHR